MPWELIPVLSWIALRAKCRHCRVPISALYPVVEISAALVAVWAFLAVPPEMVWQTCFLGWVLLTLAIIDWRTLTLPDVLTLPLIATGLAAVGFQDKELLISHALAAVTGLCAFVLIGVAYRRVRGVEGLGLGDAKLFAAAGTWLGPWGLPSVLLIGSLSALAWATLLAVSEKRLNGSRKLPFGTFLSAGIWLVWLYGPIEFK